jgi:hypothetical protein
MNPNEEPANVPNTYTNQSHQTLSDPHCMEGLLGLVSPSMAPLAAAVPAIAGEEHKFLPYFS